jgi:hypothetical protein
LVWSVADQACVSEPAGEVIELSPADWEEIENDDYPPLSDAENNELMERNPKGVPVETPVMPTLPDTHPLSEPYQDPETGTWNQDVAKLSPAPFPMVGVEPETWPTGGPLGIDDPLPYEGPETPSEIDTGEPTVVTGEVTVEICAEGDTRLFCTELGVPPEGEIPEDTFDLTWDHAPVVFSEGACPVGPTAATPWGNVTIDMYWPCEFAKAIKSIILACAMFAAAYIFIGGLRTS